MFQGMTGDLRFHHIMPALWVMEARACAHRWVVFHETYSLGLVRQFQPVRVGWKYHHRVYTIDGDHPVMGTRAMSRTRAVDVLDQPIDS